MTLEERLDRLEADNRDLRARIMASELVNAVFFARLLNVAEQIDDPMDLDQVLDNLVQDMDDALRKATPESAALLRQAAAFALAFIKEMRDTRLIYRPANT